MKIYVLFGQPKESYAEEHAPEVLLAWDEWAVEENQEEFNAACEAARRAARDRMEATRVIALEVSQERVRGLLLKTPVIRATEIEGE